MRRPAEPRPITRVGNSGAPARKQDAVAVEAPLTLTALGDVWLTTMRTPGHDRELIVGWLYHEGLIADPTREISSLQVCGQPGETHYGDAYQLVPAPAMEARLQARDPALSPRTQVTSCGLCGHKDITSLVDSLPSRPAQPGAPAWHTSILLGLFESFTSTQPLFSETGCTHAAALVNTRGQILLTREDVGRHNAVDKVIGHLALNGALPAAADQALLVSSRASFEIVHKAMAAGFGAVFCLSAPTTLAVDAADRGTMLLAGFFRAGGFNVYSGDSRLVGGSP